MKTLHVDLGDRGYDILIGSGTLKNSMEQFREILKSDRVVVITDKNVSRLYKGKILELLKTITRDVYVFEIDHGEKSKNIDIVIDLCRNFADISLDRRSTVIAFGGGVVGDIAGFAAAIYMRGIRFIQIPTTLLSSCDSSVGGKVGINLDNAKNLIGAFHQPELVVVDPDFLITLPVREMISGIGEVLKTGIICDSDLYEKISKNLKAILELDDRRLVTEIIYDCIRFKSDIVKKDEKESGLRRILNFGHTIGHGIEAALQKKGILHGESVIFGMQCSIYLSKIRKLISEKLFIELRNTLKELELPVYVKDLDIEQILTFMRKDKKVVNNRLHFVLLEDIGRTSVYDDISDTEIKEAVNYVKKLYN